MVGEREEVIAIQTEACPCPCRLNMSTFDCRRNQTQPLSGPDRLLSLPLNLPYTHHPLPCAHSAVPITIEGHTYYK